MDVDDLRTTGIFNHPLNYLRHAIFSRNITALLLVASRCFWVASAFNDKTPDSTIIPTDDAMKNDHNAPQQMTGSIYELMKKRAAVSVHNRYVDSSNNKVEFHGPHVMCIDDLNRFSKNQFTLTTQFEQSSYLMIAGSALLLVSSLARAFGLILYNVRARPVPSSYL